MSYVDSRDGPDTGSVIGGAVGGVAGTVLLFWVFVAAAKQKRDKQDRGANNGSVSTQMRTRNTTSNDRNNNRQGTVDTLPSYNQSRHDPRPPVADNDVQYDVPAAFDLATAVLLSDPQANSARRVDEEEGNEEQSRLTTFERMRHVQRKLDRLKKLTSSAPPEGYRAGSEEYKKVDELRREIARLMEEPASSRAETPVPTSVVAVGTGSSSQGESIDPSQGGSLYERMLEIQRLLARIDAITSTSPSSDSTAIPTTSPSTQMQGRPATDEGQVMTPEQISATVRDLNRRVVELMDLPDLSSTLSPVASAGSPSHSSANQATNIHGSGEGSGREETNDNDDGTADGNNERDPSILPPPYEVAISNPSDGRDLTGTGVVR